MHTRLRMLTHDPRSIIVEDGQIAWRKEQKLKESSQLDLWTASWINSKLQQKISANSINFSLTMSHVFSRFFFCFFQVLSYFFSNFDRKNIIPNHNNIIKLDVVMDFFSKFHHIPCLNLSLWLTEEVKTNNIIEIYVVW